MVRGGGRCWLAAAVAILLGATACNDSESPQPDAALLPLPDLGTLAVTVGTSGSDIDPDGYTVTVDGSVSQSVGANGLVTFTGLAAGDHTVGLSGVASNCTVSGDNPRTVSLIIGVVGTTSFSVGCAAIPKTGDLTATTSTTGSSLDPDGYTVTVDGNSSKAIGTNASVTFTGLSAGDHSVALSGVAANCSASGGTSRTVTVPAGGTASTTFAVSCAATTGNLTVTTNTTGSNLDPDGYTVVVDGSQSQAIGINTSVTFSGLSPGNHSVQLNGLAQNCTVSSNPRTVSITAGSTTPTTFTVSCAATTTTGTLTVSNSTTGSDLDPDGYTVTVSGSAGTGSQTMATNGNVIFANIPAGSYQVTLSGQAANCTVTSANPQTANVPAGGTATTSFTVSCAATTTTGNLMVSNTTTGSNIPTSPYTVTVSGAPGAASQPMAPNGSTTFTGVPPATYTVTLSGQPANCTVSNNNQSATVQAGQTANVSFTVSCTATVTPTTGDLTIATPTTGQNIPASYTLNFSGPAGSGSVAIASNTTTTFSAIPSGDYTLQLDAGATCTVAAPNPRTVTVPPNGATSTTFSVSCM